MASLPTSSLETRPVYDDMIRHPAEPRKQLKRSNSEDAIDVRASLESQSGKHKERRHKRAPLLRTQSLTSGSHSRVTTRISFQFRRSSRSLSETHSPSRSSSKQSGASTVKLSGLRPKNMKKFLSRTRRVGAHADVEKISLPPINTGSRSLHQASRRDQIRTDGDVTPTGRSRQQHVETRSEDNAVCARSGSPYPQRRGSCDSVNFASYVAGETLPARVEDSIEATMYILEHIFPQLIPDVAYWLLEAHSYDLVAVCDYLRVRGWEEVKPLSNENNHNEGTG